MGYHTDFEGQFTLDKPLTVAHKTYLEKFADVRHMRRNPDLIQFLPDPAREAVGLPVGDEGMYFVAGEGYCGQAHDDSIQDYNRPPTGLPGLWCQWVPNEQGTALEWDGDEKFYDYTEWLTFLIEHFLQPWGYVLNGEVRYQGEDGDDRGAIFVRDNIVKQVVDTIILATDDDDGEDESAPLAD